MARHSQRLSSLVRRALDERQLTPREVARMSDGKISHMTINEMARGVAPSPRKIAVFAITIGDHPDAYLEAAGEPFRYSGELSLASVKQGVAVGAPPVAVALSG